jgi:hypothetical protein
MMQKFNTYSRRRTKLLKLYNNNLNSLKDALIIRLLILNPNSRHEDVVHAYLRTGLFIERDYFEGSIRHLLEIETQYQQFKYLEKVLKWVDQQKEKVNVVFVDRCSLTEQNSANVLVSFAGTLTCI